MSTLNHRARAGSLSSGSTELPTNTRLRGGGAAGGGRRRWVWPTVAVVAVAVIVAAVVGGVVGSRNAKSSNKVAVAPAAASSSSSASSASSTSSKSAATAAAATTSAASSASSATSVAPATTSAATVASGTPVVNLVAWDWSVNKSIGMCLGNWLSLEPWMDEDWFFGNSYVNATDEWSFSQFITNTSSVANLTSVLQAHQDSWIQDSDIDTMASYGINMLRIPTPFFAWIPTVAGEPYLNNQAMYQASITRVLAKAHSLGIYAVLDLHGLPGSQNGEESSGHLTTSPAWFGNTVNQGRSDDTVAAVLAYVAASPYRSAIAGLEIINEPRPYGDAQVQELSDYYSRSYTTVQASSYPIPVFIHGAFVTNPLSYWWSFVAARATTPPSLVFEDHPYPGNFPPQTGTADILTQVCNDAKNYLAYPVPICITEWSVYTGVKTAAFETTFYEAQLATWAWSAGGMYWSFKQIPSTYQLAAGLDYSQYSFMYLVDQNTITRGTGTTLSKAEAYLSGLTNQCGDAPANVAPYNNGSVTVTAWTAEQNALKSAAATTLYAPATTAAARMAKRGAGWKAIH